eukprot:scaffold111194_cov13-Tisochrysis_lutea.AAC.1
MQAPAPHAAGLPFASLAQGLQFVEQHGGDLSHGPQGSQKLAGELLQLHGPGAGVGPHPMRYPLAPLPPRPLPGTVG